ncbi:putative immunity protein [Microbacterium albipurpureum]|uniref:putative immunity protein n=1 Tax=Microbacterium albipurpureum TaxID=3050384 RepID=UPI002FDDC3B2
MLPLFERVAPGDPRARDAIARARAFFRGELDAAGEIRRRFVAGRAAAGLSDAAAVAAARSAAQAAGVAHMGAHALGAAAYAARAAGSAAPDDPDAAADEIRWQITALTAETRAALRRLPPLGENTAGPLGGGLLARGDLAAHIRLIQAALVKV